MEIDKDQRALQAGKTQQQPDKPPNSKDHHRIMVVMWTAMSHAFGSSWVGQYGTSDESSFRSWAKALEGFTQDQIRRGCKNSVDQNHWSSHFPPNLTEFKRLCLTKESTHQSHRPFAIEHNPKRSTPETARENIAKMMGILAGTEDRDTEADLARYDRILNGG